MRDLKSGSGAVLNGLLICCLLSVREVEIVVTKLGVGIVNIVLQTRARVYS